MSAGHNMLVADISWIRLIQFIGDNIRWDGYVAFTHAIVEQITGLSPYFTRAYETDILLAPSLRDDFPIDIQEKRRRTAENILEHAEKSFATLCDMKKIDTLLSLPIDEKLWQRNDLRNPCLSWYIPYYMATRYSYDIRDPLQARKYYTIAGMQDDAPKISRILAILTFADEGDYRQSALAFFLLASASYDTEQYMCRAFVEKHLASLAASENWDDRYIENLSKEEVLLTPPSQTGESSLLAGENCYEYALKAMKQIYIGYVTEKTQSYPDLQNEEDILSRGILKFIPKIQTQKHFTIRKKDGLWRMSERL